MLPPLKPIAMKERISMLFIGVPRTRGDEPMVTRRFEWWSLYSPHPRG
jgi:hypothetical protein